MRSRFISTFYKSLVLCLLMPVPLPTSAQQPSWKTKNVALDCKDGSMTQALEQLAAQAGISILAEGEPSRRPFTLQGSGSAEKLLTQITDDYDYAWHVSNSGIVLLTRRFTDEHETPEINLAELHASLQNVLGSLRAIYTPAPPRTSLVDAFRQFAAQLSPEEAGRLKSGKGLSIASLSPLLRGQAANIIYFNELQSVYSQLDYFDRVIQALPTLSLTTQEVHFNNNTVSRYVRLTAPHSETPEPFILWDRNDEPTALPVEEHAAADTATRADAPLRKASTVTRMFALLQDRFHIAATISPKMQDKHVLLLRDADAKRALPALAELEGWMVQQKDDKTSDAFFVHRQSVNIPADARDMRASILQAFPPDVAKCFYTKPKTLGGKPYQDLHDLFPQLPEDANPRFFANGRMRLQAKAAKAKLRRSFEQETFARPIPYSSLTAEQKRLITQLLFNDMGDQAAGALGEFLYAPASYVTDPVNTRMIATGSGFIVIGPGGGRFEATESFPFK